MQMLLTLQNIPLLSIASSQQSKYTKVQSVNNEFEVLHIQLFEEKQDQPEKCTSFTKES